MKIPGKSLKNKLLKSLIKTKEGSIKTKEGSIETREGSIETKESSIEARESEALPEAESVEGILEDETAEAESLNDIPGSPKLAIKRNLKWTFFLLLSIAFLVFYLAGDLITFGMLVRSQNLEVSLPLLETQVSGMLALAVLAVLKVVVSIAILIFALAVSKQEIKDGAKNMGIPVSKLEISALEGLELEKTAVFLLAAFTIYGAALTYYNLQARLEISHLTNIEYLVLLGAIWDLLEFRREQT